MKSTTLQGTHSLKLRLYNILLVQWTPIFNVLRITLSRHVLSTETAGVSCLAIEMENVRDTGEVNNSRTFSKKK